MKEYLCVIQAIAGMRTNTIRLRSRSQPVSVLQAVTHAPPPQSHVVHQEPAHVDGLHVLVTSSCQSTDPTKYLFY